MSKRPPIGKCVHCLSENVPRNWDHVFPESWYPDTTPQNLEKWKIPSCIPCNSSYGEMERKMLNRLALTVNPENLAAMGIADRVQRGLHGAFGKSERDKAARERERANILSEMIEVTEETESGVYPTLDPHEYGEGEKKIGRPLSAQWFERLAVKIVRGITYIEHKTFIEDPYEITFRALREESDNPILQAVRTHGYTHYRGPGLVVRMGRAGEDILSSVWVIEVWQHIRLYAFCLDKNRKITGPH